MLNKHVTVIKRLLNNVLRYLGILTQFNPYIESKLQNVSNLFSYSDNTNIVATNRKYFCFIDCMLYKKVIIL
jgi:hypothetical protein